MTIELNDKVDPFPHTPEMVRLLRGAQKAKGTSKKLQEALDEYVENLEK